MNVKFVKSSVEGDIYKFTLSNLNVSYANAVRRTILSEIPICVIQTETEVVNQCHIEINTSRLHNEILKHRLSCIPIHITELDLLPDKYVLELDMTNETDNMVYVTTENFRIRNKANGNYLKDEEVKRIFPPNQKTNYYIDFMRLRPKISDSIPGEQIKLSADFSVSNARNNSMYNVVSKCAYSNTKDDAKIVEKWEALEAKLRSEDVSNEELQFKKKDFMILDAQRIFVDDSFDFVIQTIGIYENDEIVKNACSILQNKFVDMIQSLESDTVPINISETTMDNCYDVILEDEDYTIGKVLEYILYEKFFVREKTLSFCGFKKFHPHDTRSTIRIAFNQRMDRNMVRQNMKIACVEAQEGFKNIFKLF